MLGAFWTIRDYPTDRYVGSEFRKTSGLDMKNLKARFKSIIIVDVRMDDIAKINWMKA